MHSQLQKKAQYYQKISEIITKKNVKVTKKKSKCNTKTYKLVISVNTKKFEFTSLK